MDATQIIYFPYRTQKYFCPALSVISLLSVFAAGRSFDNGISVNLIFFTMLALASLVCAKCMYDAAKAAVSIGHDGIRSIGAKESNCFYRPWSDIQYGYYSRSYKGHLFLVLARDELSPSEVKQIVNKSAVQSRLCVEDKVIIYIDLLQDTSKLRSIVSQNVSFLEGDAQV